MVFKRQHINYQKFEVGKEKKKENEINQQINIHLVHRLSVAYSWLLV